MKKIKSSNRGLTFSLDNDEISIGTKYRYIVEKEAKRISIIPDDTGNMKVSKKKVGKKEKPLFDIRSKEVKALVSNADYLEIEVKEDCIVVHTHKQSKTHLRLVKGKKYSISEVLGVRTGSIVVPMTMKMAAGNEFYQYSFQDYLSTFVTDQNEISTTTSDMLKVYDVVSLFSGAGLFDKVWLDDGRFRFVYANDFCEDVIDTYRYNIGNHITCKDIRQVTSEEIPFADVFCASPCCQAFSNANRHNINSEEGKEKRLLLEEVTRLANTVKERPKVIVIENVPQMISKEDGLYISKIMSGLSDYEISVQVVTDCEVGGYSKRQRCIVIASLIGKIELPKLKVMTYKTVRDALQKVDASWFNYNDVTNPSDKTKEKMSYVPEGGNWRDIPPSIGGYGPNTQSNIMKRLKWDEPSITLSNFRKSNILHPEKNRILTVSEAATIMGLNKDFHFVSDSLSAMQQMVSNGVTQAIGKIVKNTVLTALDKYNSVAIGELLGT